MALDHVSFGGWQKNVRLRNEETELIITLEVGPRVISYRRVDGENVFKIFDDQLSGTGESEWKSRGGHRFWLAPEDAVLSYIPDNTPVEHRAVSDYSIETITAPTAQLPIRKIMTVTLDAHSSGVSVTHRAENHGSHPIEIATWGLSVMRAGGVEIIPLPRVGEHPRDLLPNRSMTLWAFTEMTDSRWNWGRRFITLCQSNAGPTKLGLAHQERWIAYHRDTSLFVKTIEYLPGAVYPDFGCNFETFTNEEMLEVESLGPLATLAPGASSEHTEHWQLFSNVDAPPAWDEDTIASWLSPYLS